MQQVTDTAKAEVSNLIEVCLLYDNCFLVSCAKFMPRYAAFLRDMEYFRAFCKKTVFYGLILVVWKILSDGNGFIAMQNPDGDVAVEHHSSGLSMPAESLNLFVIL